MSLLGPMLSIKPTLAHWNIWSKVSCGSFMLPKPMEFLTIGSMQSIGSDVYIGSHVPTESVVPLVFMEP